MKAAAAPAFALFLLCCLASEAAGAPQSNVTLTSIMPPKLDVKVTYIKGLRIQDPVPCMKDPLGTPCLPQVQAADSSEGIHITYEVKAGNKPNLTDKVQLKLCYSNYSATNRAWRAANNVISKSKLCPFLIKKGLNPVKGNYTWKPINNTVPLGTYFVRAFVVANNTANPASPNPVAFGNSVGFFQVNPINDRPTSLLIAVGVCCAIGPTFLALYFAVHAFTKKNA